MAKDNLENRLPECDKKVYKKGEHIATIINLESDEIERLVKSASNDSGQRIDWHYFGGRAVVKALGDLDKARDYLKLKLEEYGHEGYRFTTDHDSVLPWPLK